MHKFRFQRQSLLKYFANTSWLLFEKIFRSIILLITGIYVARYLGPNRFGILNYAISLVGLFSAIAGLGLDKIIVKDLVNLPKARESILGTGFVLKCIGAFLSFLFLAVAVKFTSTDTHTKLMIFIIAGGLIFQSFNVIDFYFQSIVKSKHVVFAKIFQTTISAAVKIVLIVIHASLLWFAIAILAESIILACGLLTAYLKNRLSFRNWKFKFPIAQKLLISSYPLIFSGLAISIYMKIDQIMIKEMLDATATGLYAAAVRICEAWYFLPVVITGSVFPAIIHAKKTGEKIYIDRLQKLYDLMALLAILIAVPITIWGDQLIQFLFGLQFTPTAAVMKIYIWANIPVFLGVASGAWLINENLMKYSLARTTLGCFLNVTLNLFFIPRWNIQGAAWATIFSYSLATFSIVLFPGAKPNSFLVLKSLFPFVRWFKGQPGL